MPFARLPVFAIALLLGGCVSAGPIRTPETALPAGFEGATGALAPAAIDRWWDAFGDAQLTALVERALARSSDAREAQARLAEARAIRRGALTGYGPQGNLSASGRGDQNEILRQNNIDFGGGAGTGGESLNPFAQGGLIGNANADFNVSWELDLFGRRGAARREADATLAAARFDYEASRASIAANVADALFELRGLSAQLDDARETRRIRTQLRELAAERARRGLVADPEVARVDTELAQAIADEAQIAAERQAAQRALLVLTGDAVAPTASLDPATILPPVPPSPQALPTELLARRPDVRAAEARLAAASGRLRLSELELFPRFTLQPGVSLSATSGSPFDATTLVWSLGAGLTVPILDRPRLIAELRAEEARVEQAVTAYERAVQTAFSETDQTLVRLAADRNRIAELGTGEAAARRAFAAAEISYRRGITSLADLLEAESAYRAARTTLTAARVQGLRRAVQAFKAVGGGWTPPPAAQASGSQE